MVANLMLIISLFCMTIHLLRAYDERTKYDQLRLELLINAHYVICAVLCVVQGIYYYLAAAGAKQRVCVFS